MTATIETPETEVPRQIPDTAIQDYDKALHMAYAEKPHLEDARDIGQLVARANIQQAEDKERTEDPYGEYDSTTTHIAYKKLGLHDAHEASIAAAKSAGEEAGRRYDQAQELLK